jgi:hypothetical protein
LQTRGRDLTKFVKSAGEAAESVLATPSTTTAKTTPNADREADSDDIDGSEVGVGLHAPAHATSSASVHGHTSSRTDDEVLSVVPPTGGHLDCLTTVITLQS